MKSSWSKRFKKASNRFQSDPAGKRFENLYRSVQKLSLIGRIGLGGAGLLLGVVGLFLGLVPGVPGIVLGAVGFALVAAQFKPVAVGTDHAEVAVREFWADLRSHYRFLKNSQTSGSRRFHDGSKPGNKKTPRIRSHVAG